jgi:hypothetical protein
MLGTPKGRGGGSGGGGSSLLAAAINGRALLLLPLALAAFALALQVRGGREREGWNGGRTVGFARLFALDAAGQASVCLPAERSGGAGRLCGAGRASFRRVSARNRARPSGPSRAPSLFPQFSTPSDKGLTESIALAGGLEPR